MIVVKYYILSETCENPESTPVHVTKNQVKETLCLLISNTMLSEVKFKIRNNILMFLDIRKSTNTHSNRRNGKTTRVQFAFRLIPHMPNHLNYSLTWNEKL